MKPSTETARHYRKIALRCLKDARKSVEIYKKYNSQYWMIFKGIAYTNIRLFIDCSNGMKFANLDVLKEHLETNRKLLLWNAQLNDCNDFEMMKKLCIYLSDSKLRVMEEEIFRHIMAASYWRLQARGEYE